jgi:hypothetical protein
MDFPRRRRERDDIVSTKNDGSAEQKSEIWNNFLFPATQELTAKIVPVILCFFDSNAHVGPIIEALPFGLRLKGK